MYYTCNCFQRFYAFILSIVTNHGIIADKLHPLTCEWHVVVTVMPVLYCSCVWFH